MPVATLTPGALEEARERTLDLVAPLSDADVETAHSALMSPLVWDLAHIAAYEDLWLVHRHGGEPLLHPELRRDVRRLRDAASRARRPRRCSTAARRSPTSPRCASARSRCSPATARARSTRWSSSTSSSTTRRCCRRSSSPGSAPRPGSTAAPRPRRTAAPHRPRGDRGARRPVPAGRAGRAASPSTTSAPRHRVDLRAFLIGRTPVTNATFLTFAEGGGYQRREWWSDEGWSWKEDYDITHPGGWAAGSDGWRQWRVDGWAPLHPDEPVVHVSWFEADAFARSLGARLPTEQEWEKAAAWDQERRLSLPYPWGAQPPAPGDGRANLDQTGLGPQPAGSLPAGAAPSGALGMLGDTWEWTASPFHGYPGFTRPPLPRVLRGLLRRGLPRPARRLVGDARDRRDDDVPQLGPAAAAPDLLRRAAGLGRLSRLPGRHGARPGAEVA